MTIYMKRETILNSMYLFLITLVWILITGCQTMKPIKTVEAVNLERFMGDWYVIANIPTFIERDAFNAMESYRLDADGTVVTTFRFNRGDYNGPLKTYTFRGFIQEKTANTIWGVQVLWPFKAEYRIIYLTNDYTQTVIGRSKRDYVWIMARNPSISDADYENILKLLTERGYDINQIQKIHHGKGDGGS